MRGWKAGEADLQPDRRLIPGPDALSRGGNPGSAGGASVRSTGRPPTSREEITDFGSDVNMISIVASAILLFTYAAGLLFSLRDPKAASNPSGEEHGSLLGWSVRGRSACSPSPVSRSA